MCSDEFWVEANARRASFDFAAAVRIGSQSVRRPPVQTTLSCPRPVLDPCKYPPVPPAYRPFPQSSLLLRVRVSLCLPLPSFLPAFLPTLPPPPRTPWSTGTRKMSSCSMLVRLLSFALSARVFAIAGMHAPLRSRTCSLIERAAAFYSRLPQVHARPGRSLYVSPLL